MLIFYFLTIAYASMLTCSQDSGHLSYLYAPWRGEYKSLLSNADAQTQCPLCARINTETLKADEQNLVIKRFEHCVIMLNLHPYNTGHLLIIPYAHKASLEDLSLQERQELIEVTTYALTLVKKAYKCDGANIGMNIGSKVVGGTIRDHIHMHVLPRSLGDTCFLPLLAGTQIISMDLKKVYKDLKALAE